MTPTPQHALLLGYLSKHSRGHQRARTQRRIAADLRGLGIETTTRGVRDALAALSLEGWPIGTSGRGAFLCVAPRDWRIAYRNLYGRLREQAKRCRKFKATARAALSGQRIFDFAKAAQTFADLEAAPLLAGIGAET